MQVAELQVAGCRLQVQVAGCRAGLQVAGLQVAGLQVAGLRGLRLQVRVGILDVGGVWKPVGQQCKDPGQQRRAGDRPRDCPGGLGNFEGELAKTGCAGLLYHRQLLQAGHKLLSTRCQQSHEEHQDQERNGQQYRRRQEAQKCLEAEPTPRAEGVNRKITAISSGPNITRSCDNRVPKRKLGRIPPACDWKPA